MAWVRTSGVVLRTEADRASDGGRLLFNFLGALVLTYFVSRALLLLIGKRTRTAPILAALHLCALVVALALPYLRSGVPAIGIIYPAAQATWFALDYLRETRSIK